MATGGGGDTYAGKAGKAKRVRKKLNILDIFLERKDNSISFNLKKEELSKLLFKKMKIDPNTVIKVDTSAFRTIHVEFKEDISPESFTELPAFEIRDGLRTKLCRPHHRKDNLVTVSWLDLETPDELVTHIFSHFGTLKSNIQWCKIKQEDDESDDAKLLNNILSGERQFWIELDKPIPSYAFIDQRKVKIFHLGQKRTCARCQKDGENCPGRANAKSCEENRGVKISVDVMWKTVMNNVSYKEWNGGEATADNDDHQEGMATETSEVDDVPAIEGCTGLVLDNLEENMTNEDIKTILKRACSEETLQSFTIHPTGSLRSKILKDIDPNIIPSIAKKLDKKSYKGRMVFCKPFVPKTPTKTTPEADKEETTISSDKKEDPAAMKENNAIAASTTNMVKPTIPGLPEEARLKELKVTKVKKNKPKKKKEDKKKTLKVYLDIRSLTKDDFLLDANRRSKSEDNIFKFSDDDSDEFEDTNEELEPDNENTFSTPIPFKSNFGRILARSESRARSKSVSIKRVVSPDNSDANKTGAKKKKSGIPTAKKGF